MIFDLMIDESIETWGVKEIANTIEKLFDKIGADPKEYEWRLDDIESEDEARELGLHNLFTAAQDMGMLPDFLDMDDFDFEEDIILTIDTNYYDEEEIDQIDAELENLEGILGLEVKINKD